jgi:UDP-glucose-4-epimerase GalE
MTTVLVTGGAGYVGSHTVKQLRRIGWTAVVLDDLSEGHREAVGDAELVVGDVGSREVLDGLLGGRRFDGAIHFAARAYVGESMLDPRLYWRRNVSRSQTLVEALVDHEVPAILFSSSCTVYGEREGVDLDESMPAVPVSPYGRTKASVEWLLEDFARAYGISTLALRYFNAAGADPEGDLGEDHDPETHLVPLVIREALEESGALKVFGTDWPTPDGTCVRDYVHVTDLADAHVRGLRYLLDGGTSTVLNLGTGHGHSVREVIRAVEACSGHPVEVTDAPRRDGDTARMVAVPGRAREVLGWEPVHSSLDEIVGTAWRWHRAHPGGYE